MKYRFEEMFLDRVSKLYSEKLYMEYKKPSKVSF